MTTAVATTTNEATTAATPTIMKPTITPKKQMTPTSSATTTNSPPVEPSPYGNVDDLVIKTNERVRWTEELHEIFVKTTLKLGPKAVPSRILSEMNCKQLTREQVASHLQNYRSILFPPAAGAQDKKAPAAPKKNAKSGQTSAAAGKRKLEENAIQPKGSSRKKQKAQKPTQTKITPQPARVVVKTETAPKVATQPIPTILAASPIPAEFQLAPSNEQHAFVNSFLSEELFAATSNVGGCTAGSCAFEHQFVEGRLALLQSGDHDGRLDFLSTETQPSIQRQEEPSSTERHEERAHSMVEVEEDLFSPSSSCASSPYSSPEPVAPIPKSQPFFNILSSETAPFELDFPGAPSTKTTSTSELVELQLSLDDFFSNFQHSASQVGTGASTTEFPFFEMGSAEPNPCFCCPTVGGSAKTIEI